MSVSLETNAPEAFANLANRAKQIEFAIVVALTRTAKAAQKTVQGSLAKQFILKNSYTARGIRIKPATKLDPVAEVYSLDEYIAQHEAGGQRVLGEAFIPVAIREALGLAKNKVIPKKSRAQALLANPKSKLEPHRGFSKTGKPGVFGKLDGRRRMLYLIFTNPIRIKKNAWFFNAVDEAYINNFSTEYDRAVAQYVFK